MIVHQAVFWCPRVDHEGGPSEAGRSANRAQGARAAVVGREYRW